MEANPRRWINILSSLELIGSKRDRNSIKCFKYTRGQKL